MMAALKQGELFVRRMQADLNANDCRFKSNELRRLMDWHGFPNCIPDTLIEFPFGRGTR